MDKQSLATPETYVLWETFFEMVPQCLIKKKSIERRVCDFVVWPFASLRHHRTPNDNVLNQGPETSAGGITSLFFTFSKSY